MSKRVIKSKEINTLDELIELCRINIGITPLITKLGADKEVEKCIYDVSIGDIRFSDCTFKIFENISRFYCLRCKFNNCKFEGMKVEELYFSPLRMFNVTFSNCVVDTLGFIPFVNKSEYEELFDHTTGKYDHYKALKHIQNVDFTGMKYRRFVTDYCTVAGYSGISDIIHELLNNENILLNKPVDIPEFGKSFIGYKVVQLSHGRNNKANLGYMIAKLEIPATAKRLNTYSHKCRAAKAKVLDFININVKLDDEKFNKYKSKMIAISPMHVSKPIPYVIGAEVISDSFDENDLETCSNGIHFFMTEEDARDFYDKSIS